MQNMQLAIWTNCFCENKVLYTHLYQDFRRKLRVVL